MVNLLNISYSESCQITHNQINQLYLTNHPIVVVAHRPDPTIVAVHQPHLTGTIVVAHQPHPTIVAVHQPHPTGIIVIAH